MAAGFQQPAALICQFHDSGAVNLGQSAVEGQGRSSDQRHLPPCCSRVASRAGQGTAALQERPACALVRPRPADPHASRKHKLGRPLKASMSTLGQHGRQ